MEISEEKLSGITRITSTNFSYKWTIQNYKSNDKKTGEYIRSPLFNCSKKKDIKWTIRLYPQGKNENYKNDVAIYLELVAKSPNEIKSVTSFSIINSDGRESYKEEVPLTYIQPTAAGIRNYIRRDYLLNDKNNLLPNNTLTILCRVRIDNQIENLIDDYNTKFTECKATLYNELETLFKNKLFTDVTITVNEIQLQAHKVILASKSPVFLAMLQNDMREKNSSIIEIVDFESNIISEMLLYLYSGKVENMVENCNNLLRLADKYDIEGLKLSCEEYLCNKLCVDNAVETLIIADRHNCNALKSHIMKFIVAHAKDIAKTPQFESLPSLVKEMILVIV